MTAQAARTDHNPRSKKKRSPLGLLFKLLLIVLIVLGIGLALLPRFAGPLVKNAVASAAKAQGTTASIGAVSLSWMGSQRLDNLRFNDNKGTSGDVSVTVPRGLLSLATGNLDLGTVTVSGEATVDSAARTAAAPQTPGTPAPAPSSGPGTSAPPKLPAGLAVKVDITSFRVRLIEPNQPETAVDLKGTMSLAAGQPVTIDLNAAAARAGSPGGTLRLAGKVAGLIAADGTIDQSKADADVTAALANFPSMFLDALIPGANGVVAAALGNSVSADVVAKGNAQDLIAQLTLNADNAKSDASVRIAGGQVTQDRTITLSVLDTGPILRASPQAAEALAKAGINITTAPRVEATIPSLRATLPKDGAAFDLRSLSTVVDLTLTPLTGTIAADKLGRQGGPVPLGSGPMQLKLDLTDPARAATLKGGVNLSLDGRAAGSLAIDATTGPLVDAAGKAIATPAVNGTVSIRDLPTALAQPFVPADAKLDLARDVGPSLTLDALVNSAGSDQPLGFEARVASANITARLRGTRGLDEVVRLTEPGVITIQNAAPVLDRYAAASGTRFTAASPVTLTIRELTAPVKGLSATPPQYQGLKAVLTLQADSVSGTMRQGEGEAAKNVPFVGERLDTTITIDGSTANLGAALQGARLENRPLIRGLRADLRVPDIGAKELALGGVVTIDAIEAPALTALLGPQQAAALNALGTMKLELRPETAPGGVQKITGTLVGPALDAAFDATMNASGLSGRAQIRQIAAAALDAITKKPGLAAAGLGQTVAADATFSAGRKNGELDFSAFDAQLALQAEKLKSSGPLRLKAQNDVLTLTQPATLTWTMEPAFLDALNAPATNAAAGASARKPARLAAPTTVTLDARSLRLPLKPTAGAMAAEIALAAPTLDMLLPDGSRRSFTGFAANLASGAGGTAKLTAALAEGGAKVLDAQLDVADAGTPNQRATGRVVVDRLATPILDAFTGSDLISGLLGQTVSAQAQLANFPAEGGTIALNADAPYTKLAATGRVQGGRFSLTQPASLTVSTVTKEFGFKLARFVPVFASLTKDAATDRPASISIASLSLPTTWDFKQAAMAMTMDIGTISYDLGFGELLNANVLNAAGRAGDSFAPFQILADAGVVRTQGLAFPIGEFQIPAASIVDLNSQREDLSIELPVGALAAEAARGAGGGGLLEGLTIPARRQGPLDSKNQWKLDFAGAVKPEKVLDNVIKKGLEDLFKKKD